MLVWPCNVFISPSLYFRSINCTLVFVFHAEYENFLTVFLSSHP